MSHDITAPTGAPNPVVRELTVDGQLHPFTANDVPTMVALLTYMAEGSMLIVLRRDLSDDQSRQSPAQGWRIDPGDVSFSHWENQLYIGGRDTRIVDDEGFLNCTPTVFATPGQQYEITAGRMVRFQSDSEVLELVFVTIPVTTAPTTPASPAAT